jgi:hypothetical protein
VRRGHRRRLRPVDPRRLPQGRQDGRAAGAHFGLPEGRQGAGGGSRVADQGGPPGLAKGYVIFDGGAKKLYLVSDAQEQALEIDLNSLNAKKAPLPAFGGPPSIPAAPSKPQAPPLRGGPGTTEQSLEGRRVTAIETAHLSPSRGTAAGESPHEPRACARPTSSALSP